MIKSDQLINALKRLEREIGGSVGVGFFCNGAMYPIELIHLTQISNDEHPEINGSFIIFSVNGVGHEDFQQMMEAQVPELFPKDEKITVDIEKRDGIEFSQEKDNSTYMTVAAKYETKYLLAMAKSRDDCVHVPEFEDVLYEGYEDQAKSSLLAESIEAMVVNSEARFGKQYHLMITPVLNYLYDKYDVDPADLEFISMLYLRSLIRSGSSACWSSKEIIRKTIDMVVDEIGAGDVITDEQREEIYRSLLEDSTEEE